MGKKQKKDKAREINVEIAPGNQRAMDDFIERYNTSPDRATPKITYTDVVNDAIDQFLRQRRPRPRTPREEKTREEKG
ncbi:MAG TPA: hypothetical protein VHE79_00010 [Spirochaetia bacterium]